MVHGIQEAAHINEELNMLEEITQAIGKNKIKWMKKEYFQDRKYAPMESQPLAYLADIHKPKGFN